MEIKKKKCEAAIHGERKADKEHQLGVKKQ